MKDCMWIIQFVFLIIKLDDEVGRHREGWGEWGKGGGVSCLDFRLRWCERCWCVSFVAYWIARCVLAFFVVLISPSLVLLPVTALVYNEL